MEGTQKTIENTKKVLHKNCVCSECGQTPIEGIRYHCLVCQIYDICPKCEEKCGEKHGHQLLKLRRPHDLDKYLKLIYKKDEKENIKKMEEECEKNNKTEVKDFRDELDNYIKGGIIEEVKIPKKMEYLSYKDYMNNPNFLFELDGI